MTMIRRKGGGGFFFVFKQIYTFPVYSVREEINANLFKSNILNDSLEKFLPTPLLC